MATSGSTDFSIDRNGLINAALRLIGVLDPEGGTASATQITNAAEALNMMIGTWRADGLPLWAVKKSSFALTASQAGYTVSALSIPRPLRVIEAFIRDTGTSSDTPIRVVSRQEYQALGNKASTGTPVLLYYDPQLTDALATVYLYPAPDSTAASGKQVHILYHRPFEDFDASTDTPDFPQAWYEAIKYGLAVRLAPEYRVPIQERQQLTLDASAIKGQVMALDTEEGSIYFQPDFRG